MGKKVTELTSYCGDTYQKVELANNTFYHRIKRKGDIAFAPSTLNLSLAVTEVDLLTAERDRYKVALENILEVVGLDADQLECICDIAREALEAE